MVTSQSKQNAIEAIKRNVGIDIVKNGSISNGAYKDQDTRLKTILANINDYKVFAFDFDETLTMDHTSGHPYFYINIAKYPDLKKYNRFVGKTTATLFGQGGLAKLFAMINAIQARGIAVYIVSRGEYAQLVTTFRDNFKINGESLLNLIGGESHIYGALPTIMNENSKLPEDKIPVSTTNAKFNLGNTTWPDHKLEYLKAILEKEIQNILFFDDDHANIEALYSNAGSTMIDGIQQNKKQGLNATLAIVTELLKLRGGSTATQPKRSAPPPPPGSRRTRAGNNINYPSPAGKLRSGLPHRNAPPPPSGRPAPPLPPPRQHLPIPGADNALPPSPKTRQISTFRPVTLKRNNNGGNTTPVVAEEPIMGFIPAHKDVSGKKNNYIANENLPLPEAQRNLSKGPVITFPHPSNQHPNKTKKRFREGLLKAGEFGKAVVQGALHRMGRKQLFYGNQTEQMKPSPTKKKGFFGRLLSGTRKRVPSMGKVKRLFGRNQSKTNTAEKVPLLTKPEVTKSQKFGLGNRVLRMFGRNPSTQKSAKKKPNADRHNANVELIPKDEASEIARTVPTPASSAVNQVINLFGEYNVTIHKTMVPMNTFNTKTNISNISFTKVDGTPINPTEMTLPEIPGMPDEEKNDENRLYMGKVSRAIKPIINSANEDLNRHSFNITTSDASAKMIADLKHIDTLVTELKTHYDKTQTYTKVIKNGDRLARLLDKYDVYTKTDSNPLEYIFVDNAGNIVPLDRLRLPNVEIPADSLENARRYLANFKLDFVSGIHSDINSEPDKQLKLGLITGLNKQFESIAPNTKITESTSTMPQQNNTHMPPPLPPRVEKNAQPDTLEPTPPPPLHQQNIQVKNSPRISLSQTRTARNTTTQSSSGNKNTAQSSGNKNIPVPPPRTKKNRQQFFNIQTTIITDIHKDFLTKLTQTLSGSDNQVIKDNATAIANCINQPVSCNIQELKVSNHKDSIHALLSLVLDELEVGITKRGSILSRVNLF